MPQRSHAADLADGIRANATVARNNNPGEWQPIAEYAGHRHYDRAKDRTAVAARIVKDQHVELDLREHPDHTVVRLRWLAIPRRRRS